MPWAQIGIVVLRVVLVFALLLLATLINVWAERKVVADMQSRLGPMRAGPWGILQTVADGLKLFFKESITPRKVELGMFLLAPFLAVIPAFLIFMVVPFGVPFTIGGEEVILQGADLDIGLLFILAMSSMAVYSVVLAGWSSGSKYPLIGGIRATAQAISYEAAMGLAMVAVVMFTATQGEGGTLSLAEIVARQGGTWGGIVPRWNVFPQIVAFVIFMFAIVAETNRAPFDLVEAEQEIVGGYHTEYSGMRFAMFFLAEYVNIFTMSAIAATLFLGGWHGPTWEGTVPGLVSAVLPTVWFLVKTYAIAATLFLGGWHGPTWEGTVPGFVSAVLPTVWFLVKTYAIIFVFFWLRATLPRLRYDQLMTLGWKRLIPAALTWIMVSAVAMGVRQFGLPWAGS